NGSRQRHSSPSSLASGSSTDETGPPHRIPDSPGFFKQWSIARDLTIGNKDRKSRYLHASKNKSDQLDVTRLSKHLCP
ncbi:hypothetical protein CN161_33490, partial [Sinorhizobium meliloti]